MEKRKLLVVPLERVRRCLSLDGTVAFNQRTRALTSCKSEREQSFFMMTIPGSSVPIPFVVVVFARKQRGRFMHWSKKQAALLRHRTVGVSIRQSTRGWFCYARPRIHTNWTSQRRRFQDKWNRSKDNDAMKMKEKLRPWPT
jgi:hypothetical protein